MNKHTAGNSSGVAIALLLAALSSSLAYAGGTLEAKIASCRTISDAPGRLACFDSIQPTAGAEVQATTAAGGATLPASAASGVPTQQPAAKPAKVAAETPRDGSFGSETVQVKTVDQSKNLTARVIGSINGVGKGQRIRLDNGQVWLSTDDRSYDYEATSPSVTITRNFAGNYWMKLSDSSFQFRVRRIQ